MGKKAKTQQTQTQENTGGKRAMIPFEGVTEVDEIPPAPPRTTKRTQAIITALKDLNGPVKVIEMKSTSGANALVKRLTAHLLTAGIDVTVKAVGSSVYAEPK